MTRFELLLRDREALYRDIVEHSRDLLCFHALDGTILAVNETPAHLLGYTVDELLQKPLSDLIAPEFRHEFQSYIEEIKRSGFATGKMALITRSGERRIWEYYNVLRTEAVPEPIVRGVAHDVTESVATERKLRQHLHQASLLRDVAQSLTSGRTLNEVIDAAIEGVQTAAHPDLVLVFLAENQFLRLLSASGLLKEEYYTQKPPVHRLAECLCGLAAQDMAPLYSVDIHSDCRCTWEECKRVGVKSFAALPLKDERNRVLGVLGIASMSRRDFSSEAGFLETLATEISLAIRNSILLQEAENRAASLARSESLLRSFVETAPYGITRASLKEDRFLAANPAAVRILGYGSEEEVLALRISALYLDPDGRRKFLAQVERNPQFQDVELAWKRKDGSPLTIRASGRVVHDDRSSDDVIEGIMEDITERSLLQQQFFQAQKMEAVGRLAGGVAHDFNNLLNIILGYTELLRGHAMPSGTRMIEQIQLATNRAAALTRQLLAFSRKQVVSPKDIDLNVVVEETEKMLRRLIGEDIHLEVHLSPKLPATRIDPSQVTQVLMNLAVNARDAMPNGGRLVISTANVVLDSDWQCRDDSIPAGAFVKLTIADTGIGIDREHQEHIFDPFFTTKSADKGTGLGLSTVYGIVRQAGGYIDFESEVGSGTRFDIFLPVSSDTPTASVTPDHELLRVPGGNETILLAEDTAALQEFLAQALLAKGYSVLRASDGSQALQVASAYPGSIHLLVTDVVMPLLSGTEVADRLKKVRPSMKVLYVSGYTADWVDYDRLRAEGYLQKPFTVAELTRKIRDILDSSTT